MKYGYVKMEVCDSWPIWATLFSSILLCDVYKRNWYQNFLNLMTDN